MGDFVPRLRGRAFGEAMVSGHAVRAPFVGVKCHNVSYRTTMVGRRWENDHLGQQGSAKALSSDARTRLPVGLHSPAHWA